MQLIYKKATIEDIECLTESRIEVLKSANQLSDDADLQEVKEQSYIYYQKALQEGNHIAYLVFDGNHLAATGGVSFYQVLPTYHNPTGKKAYIMNMYTRPEYRRRKIAFQLLERLVQECREKGITAISLEATDMGRPLYERFGFVSMHSEMELISAERKKVLPGR